MALYSGDIVDCHHHIWRMADLPWLAGPMQPRVFGEYSAIKRDYPIEEYIADSRTSRVTRSVYVQTNWPTHQALEEVVWVQSVADRHALPNAIVGFADLGAPDVAALLDAQLAGATDLRGVRQQLHWHEKPLYRFEERPDLMNEPAWRRGLKEVEKRNLVFELQVFASQMSDAARLAREHPNVSFVLLHAGMVADRSAEGWAAWRRGMRELAACDNVFTKLSGLGTFVRACSIDLWRPVVEETLAIFGPQRCMFGSNFPIEKLWTDYASLITTLKQLLSSFDDFEQRAVFHDTAARVYRLN